MTEMSLSLQILIYNIVEKYFQFRRIAGTIFSNETHLYKSGRFRYFYYAPSSMLHVNSGPLHF